MAMHQMYYSVGPMVPDPEPLSFWGSKNKNKQKKIKASHASNAEQVVNLVISTPAQPSHRRDQRASSSTEATALPRYSQIDAVPQTPPTSRLRSVGSLARLRGRGRSSGRTSPPPPSYREPSPVPPLPVYTLPSPPSSRPVTSAESHSSDEDILDRSAKGKRRAVAA
ncbi:hypothetical protein PENSPDRAFT_648374 [Peniophora sp. CONT]|nr:hypothetical protein PENSPDRAFT_648374 [Peniophora sp. CONT]